ncbi:MAG TPA: FAD-binding protein [Pseudomonadales bacterium]|nr:FAD-binding protein [Pseudomonadales bacterium]
MTKISNDVVVDVLVVGSGAGGMTAAITAHDQGLETLLIEKADVFGGTSAMSGGVVWIPDNHLMKKTGIKDSPAEAMAYLQALTAGEVPVAKLQAYVSRAPEMLRYLERHTFTRFNPATEYADYYAHQPGYKPGARSLDPKPFSLRRLKKHGDEIRLPSTRGIFGRINMTAIEAHNITRSATARNFFILWRLLVHFLDIPYRLQGKRDNRLVLGQSLTGSLRASMLKRDMPLWLNTGLDELIIENGRVAGVLAHREGKPVTIRARKGVILACGGFGKNAGMRQQYQQQPIGAEWSSANPFDRGDGILAGEKIGAQLAFMHCAWWSPSIILPNGNPEALIIGKSLPGGIFVNQAGQRFTNEAAPYEDVVKAQYRANTVSPSIPCYMIFDARHRNHYTLANGRIYPGKMQPDDRIPEEFRNSDFFIKADSLEALAQKTGIDANGLRASIERFNRFAETGKDEDFQRGETAQDCYYSDPETGYPNPTLAPIREAPFYCIKIWPGDLGTKGGLKTDEAARVLDTSDNPIPGLYATGNASGAVMGNSYPGAGSTLGPAMTFGYLAALDMSAKA